MNTFLKTNKSNAVLRNFILTITVLVSCSLSFAATPGTAKNNNRQEAATADPSAAPDS
jgi:hypothetical protein